MPCPASSQGQSTTDRQRQREGLIRWRSRFKPGELSESLFANLCRETTVPPSNSQVMYQLESSQYARMPRQKNSPLETMSGSFGCCFTRYSGLTVFSSVLTDLRLLRFPQGGLAAMLPFHTKSEGQGKPAQWWNDSNVDFFAGLLEILWLTSGAVDSTTTSTRPAITLSLECSLLLLGPAVDDSLCGAYTCIIPVELTNYSRLTLYVFTDRLFRKLCGHIRRISKQLTALFHTPHGLRQATS